MTRSLQAFYSFHGPGAWPAHLAVPPARPAPFPPSRQRDLLERMALTWKVQPSLGRRLKPPTHQVFTIKRSPR
jgi:hypothetical protein